MLAGAPPTRRVMTCKEKRAKLPQVTESFWILSDYEGEKVCSKPHEAAQTGAQGGYLSRVTIGAKRPANLLTPLAVLSKDQYP